MPDLSPDAVAQAVASLSGTDAPAPAETTPTAPPVPAAPETPPAAQLAPTEAPPPPEAPKPEEKPPEKQDLPGAKMQAAIRKEQELRRERESLDKQRQEFSAAQRELEEVRAAREAFARGDHRAIFRAFGTSFNEVAHRENEALKRGSKPDQGQPAPEQPKTPAEVAALKEELAQMRQQLAYQQNQADFATAKSLIQANRSSLKYVARFGDRGATQVFQLIRGHQQENGGSLPGDGTWEDAVRVTGEAINKALADDVALLTAEDAPATVVPVAPKAAAPSPQANSGTAAKPTLTNSQAAATPPRNGALPKPVPGSLSQDEIEAAIQAMGG